jgi:hypothetical protein
MTSVMGAMHVSPVRCQVSSKYASVVTLTLDEQFASGNSRENPPMRIEQICKARSMITILQGILAVL